MQSFLKASSFLHLLETKGSMSSMELRKIESTKIECAKRFFNAVNKRIMTEHVQYDVVDSFGKLMDIVK